MRTAPILAASFTKQLEHLGELVVTSVVFVAVGLLVFVVAFWTMTKLAPFSVRKEIEEDQNTSLGIVMGSVILGLALIISSAIRG